MHLTPEQLDELRELVTPAAWAAHEALGEKQRVNLPVRLRMVGGDLNRLAAAVLRVVCQTAQDQAAEAQSGAVKRFKVDGEYEEEYFPGTSLHTSRAASWCAEAGRLEALALGSGVPGAAFTEWS